MAKTPSRNNDSNANLGFEARLWLTADKLRSNMDAAEYMVAFPGQLVYSTQIPVCLWFIARNKSGQPSPGGRAAGAAGKQLRDRTGETLFIDARKLGTLIDRVHRELTDADLQGLGYGV